MTTGEGLLIAGVAGVGVFAYLKFRQTQPPPGAPPGAPKAVGGFTLFPPPLPLVPQISAVLAPIANNVTTPLVNKLNKSVSGPNVYGPPVITNNPDGSVTSKGVGGTTITYHPGGGVTISGGGSSVQQKISSGATGVIHAIGSIY